MDFSVLLKDLRDVAEKYQGRSSEPQVSTHVYVDTFTKVLKRAQKLTEEYDDQITVLWVALNQLASFYKDLSAGSARDQLCKFIFGLCAKTVLNIQWAQLDEDSKVKKNFSTTVESVHNILSQLGFHKFQLILDLMESHWTHPVLSKIMSGEEDDTEDCLEYIQKEDPDILKLRIEIMMKENCEEFALNLCTWSLKHPQLLNDLKIKEHQIFMLYKQQEYGKMQEVCETIVCHDGIKVMSHLAKTPSNQELCIRLAQVFLIQDWMRPERTCCTQELLKLWIHHQYLADKDEERFLDSIWTVAKVCRDTEQIGVLIDGVRKECGDMFIQLYTELCKYAINIDKGNMEREEVQRDKDEYNKRRLAMSKTCVRMAFMLKEYDFRMSRICGLTAFSLDPTTENLNLVNKLYWTIKNVSAASQNSKINIATLYEIERLLGQIRPEMLNPEYSWKQIIPICKKYKLDFENAKNGVMVKKELAIDNAPSQSSSLTFTGNTQSTPLPNMLSVVNSDKNATKYIDTGQKKGRKPKQHEIPKDIQKTHLTKLLKQKNLSNEEIEKVLSKEFPRNVSQNFSVAPSLDVKELDKTINDLKKSIDSETRYRQLLKHNISTIQGSRKRNETSVNSSSAMQSEHVSRQEQFRQQQLMLHSKSSSVHRQHSTQGGSQAQGPILHRQLSVGSPQPPHAHSHHRQQQVSQMAAFGGSPPPAHSTSPRLSSPTGFQSPLSPPGYRPHSASPTVLNSRKSGALSQMQTSHSRSNTVNQLCNKVQGDIQKQSSRHTKSMESINILRPPGSSSLECAKIAQQVAELQEKQRAEKKARRQGEIDCKKAALNSHNILSRSQISDLLSLTFQGNKSQKVSEGQKTLIATLQGTDISSGKSYLKKKIERSVSLSSVRNVTSPQHVQRSSDSVQSSAVAGFQSPTYNTLTQSSLKSPSTARSHSMESVQGSKTSTESNILVPGEQGWDPSRGILKQKYMYYYKATTSKDGTGKSNSGESSLTVKPMYKMIVPKELTKPDRKEDLVKTVTNMMMQQQKSAASSSQVSASTPAVLHVQNNSQPIKEQKTNVTQQLQMNTSQKQVLAAGIMQNNCQAMNNQSNVLSSVAVSSQNLVEDGLLNLNTLAAASVSVLGQTSDHQQIVCSVQQPAQAGHIQQMFASSQLAPQTMYTPVQSVQQVVQQPEAILATPLYTVPAPMVGEPVLSQQVPGIQQQVNLGLQQPVLQQITVQNPPLALNSSPQFVNVPSQQPAFQVTAFEQVTNFSGVPQPLTAQITPSMSTGISGGFANSVLDELALSMSSAISQAVSGEITQPMTNVLSGTMSSASVRSMTQNQFISTPELSPAVFQQILTGVKKVGSCTKPEIGQTPSTGVRCPQNSLKKFDKDDNKQIHVSRNEGAMKESVNEARQKILELRKQYGQTGVPQTDLPHIATVATSQVVPSTLNNTVASPKKTSGLLERLMSEDNDLKKLKVSLPQFLPPSQPNTVTSLSDVTCLLQVVPDLPDLGAKEFQIDSLLALDNENSNVEDNTVQHDQLTQQNVATSAPFEAKSTDGLVGESRLKHKESDGQINLQVETSVNVSGTNNTNLLKAPQTESRQEILPVSQSTYYNANRLGKERENREVKDRENKEEKKYSQEEKPPGSIQMGKKVTCSNCDLSFPTEQHLHEHNQISNCSLKWQCTYCKMTFKCADILKSHEKNYCLKAPSAMVKCYNCGVYFHSHEQLKAHLNPKTCVPQNVHGKQSSEEIVCGICAHKFDSMNSIKEHVKIGCIKKDSSRSDNRLQDYDLSVTFKCTICNFMNLNENIVSKHVEKCKENNITAELTKLYKCNMCQEAFCHKEDGCRHVTRQCPKLKVTNTQRQIQGVYQRLKSSSTSSIGQSEKSLNFKENTHARKERDLEEENNGNHEKETANQLKVCMTNLKAAVSKQKDIIGSSALNIKNEDIRENVVNETLAINTQLTSVLKSRQEETDLKHTQNRNLHDVKPEVVMQQESKDGLQKKVPAVSDKLDSTVQLQKEQRISAENRFFAEFNEIEKRKQALRMKKQKELERMEKARQRKELELLREHKSQVDKEKLKQKFHVEKQDKEQLKLENEKRKYMDEILGNATLQQKMKESIENKKKTKSEKIKDGTVKVLNILKVESKEMKTQNTESQNNIKLEKKMENSFTVSQKIRHASDIMKNKKKRNSVDDGDFVDKILVEEKKVLKEHVQIEEIKTQRKDVFTKDISHDSSRNIKKKQRSPQDIRKMKGLRAKRLIKRQKFFIENFEMIPLRKDKLKKESEQTEANTNLLNLSRTNIGSAERLDACKNKSKVQVKEEGKLEETNNKVEHQEHNQEKYRHFCRFCDFKSNPESSKKLTLVSHYIKSHKLGFRQVNYSYYCNFCIKKFPSTQTLQVKEHVFQCHGEAVLKRAASGRYNRKVQQAVKTNKFPPVKTRFISRFSGTAVQTNKHLRALALREKCAEKLRIIALAHKDAVVDYNEYNEEGFIQSSSNNSTDTESRKERIADVSAKIALLSKEARGTDSNSTTENKDGRRIAPRLARQMVKEKKGRSNSVTESDMKTSEVDDSSDSQILTRSRSNSASSSSRSGLIASAKKRKAAIAISTGSSKGSRSQFSRSNKLQLTRSGRIIKRPEIDYDKLTESSGLGSGEDTCNSDFEDSEIRRRKSTRVRRLSERGKLSRDAVSETDESSTEEIKPRETRLSLSRGQKVMEGKECDSESTDKEDKKRSAKRIRTDKNMEGRSNRESENTTNLKKSLNKNTLVRIERINTRQNSKNVKESDSETETNYTDIENTVKLLGLKNMEKTAEGSAESDSGSTSVDIFRKRKYKLRKRSSDKKYIESDSSEEERTSKDSFKQTNGNNCLVLETLADKPKVVLIGAEDDDDLNVDYGIDKRPNECPNFLTHENSQNLIKNSECISCKKEGDEFAEEESTTVDTKVMTVLVNPEDEFADLKSALEKPYQTESEFNSELSNEGECTKSFAMPATVMDEDEFKFLKDSEISVGTCSEKKNVCSILSASKKAAFDSEFIKYAETEKSEDDSECETDTSDRVKEKQINMKFDVIVEKSLNKGLSLEVPPLLEDVPVLAPRNVDLSMKMDTDMDQEAIKEQILSNIQEHCKESEGISAFADSSESKEISTVKSKPMLKSARVVIEDILVVKRALEAENTDKKLREECEASKCTVRIGRLSKKEIEKHSPFKKGNIKEKEELDIIVIESDSEGPDEITSVRFNNRDLRQDKRIEEKIQKSHRAVRKTTQAEGYQYETLIKDIVLDDSIINKLLENENIEADERVTVQPGVDVNNQKPSARIKGDGGEERPECVQIESTENYSLPDSVLALDSQCDTSNQEDTRTAVESNNVTIVTSETGDDISLNYPQSEKEKSGKEIIIGKEIEDEVWIENAESYAETTINCKSVGIRPCKNEGNTSDELNLILPNTAVTVESVTNVTYDNNHESSECHKELILGNNGQIGETTSKTKMFGTSEINTVTCNLSLKDAETNRNISDIVSDVSKIAEENNVNKSFENLESDIVSDATKIAEENSVKETYEKLEDEKNILTAALNKKESSIASLEVGDLNDTSSLLNNEIEAGNLNKNSESFELDREDYVGTVLNNLSESCFLVGNKHSVIENGDLQYKLQLQNASTIKDTAGSCVIIDKLNGNGSSSDIEERQGVLSSVEIDPQIPEECIADNKQGGAEEMSEMVDDNSKNKKLLLLDSCKVVDKLKETTMQEIVVEQKNKNELELKNAGEHAIELTVKNDICLNIETYETCKESNTDETLNIHHASQDSLGTKTLIKNNTDEDVEKNEPCPLPLLDTKGSGRVFVPTNVLKEKTENVEHDITVDHREVFSGSSGEYLICESGKSNNTQEKDYLSNREEADSIAGTQVSCTSSELKMLEIKDDSRKTETELRNKEIDETVALVLVEIQKKSTQQPYIQKEPDSVGFMKDQSVFAETDEGQNVTAVHGNGTEGNKNTIENIETKISIEPVLVNEDWLCDSSCAKTEYCEIETEENDSLSLTDISEEIETKNENEVNNGLIPESNINISQERSETTSFNISEEYTVDVDADMATATPRNESSENFASQICENEKIYDLPQEGLYEENNEIIAESSDIVLSQDDNIHTTDMEKEKFGLILEHKSRNENTNNTHIFTDTEATGGVGSLCGAFLPTAVGEESNDYEDRVTDKSSILFAVESGVEKDVLLHVAGKRKVAEASKDKIRTSESAENDESAETKENSESRFGTEKMKVAEASKDKIRTSENAENEKSAETKENSESSFGTEKMKIAEASIDKIRTSESAENEESAETMENSESSFEENAFADVNDKLLKTSRNDVCPTSVISKIVKNTPLLAIQSYTDPDSDIELIDFGISNSEGSLESGHIDTHSHSIQVIEQVIQDKEVKSDITDRRLNSVAENISSYTDKPDLEKICDKGDKGTNYESEIFQAGCSKTDTEQPSACVGNGVETVTIMKNTSGSKDFSKKTPNENKEKAIGGGSSEETTIKEQDTRETCQSNSEVLSNDETYLSDCVNIEADINMGNTEKQTSCEADSIGKSSTVCYAPNKTIVSVTNVLNDNINPIVQENVIEKVKMDFDITDGSTRTVENILLDSSSKKSDGKTDIDIIPSLYQIQDKQVQNRNTGISDREHSVEENTSEMKCSSSNTFEEDTVDSDKVKTFELPTANMSAEVDSVQSCILPVTLKDNEDMVKTNQREVDEVKDMEEDESPYLLAHEQSKGKTLGISEIQKEDEENVENLELGITRKESISSSSDISLISFPEYMTEQDEADNDKRELLVESKSSIGTSVNIKAEEKRNEINLDRSAVLQQIVPESVYDKAASIDSSKTYSIKPLEVVEISPLSVGHITLENWDISRGDTRAYKDHEIIVNRNGETEQTGNSCPTDSSNYFVEIPCVSNLDVNEMTKVDSEIVHATEELDSSKDTNIDNDIDSVGDIAKRSIESGHERNKCQLESFSNKKDESKHDSEIKRKTDITYNRESGETQKEQYTDAYENISMNIEKIDKQEKVIDADRTKKDDEQYLGTASSEPVGSSPVDKNEDCKQTCSVETIVDVQHSHENAQQLETSVADDKHDEITLKSELNKQLTHRDILVLKNDSSKKNTSQETCLKTAQDEKVPSIRVKSQDPIQENEEKRKIFETPSPRRKGMIVGSTCVLKKPASPFIETKVTEKPKPKIESLPQLGNRTGKQNEFAVNNDGNSIQGTERSLLHIRNQNEKGLHKSIRFPVNQRNQRKPISSEKGNLKLKEKNQLLSAENKGNVTVSDVHKKESHSHSRTARSDKQQSSVKSEKKDPGNEIIEKKINLSHIQTLELDRSQKIPHEVQGEDRTLPSFKDSGRERKLDNPSRNDKFISQSASSSCVNSPQSKEVSKKSADSSEHKGSEKGCMTKEKTSDGKSDEGETVTREVQLDNETDEEFRRRTETVRCARKRSAVKPYESDFNFEENESSKRVRDTNVKPSTAFWPSESESKIENFDTTSLYSNSSSGSSTNEGKSKVIARCARDFGKEDVVKQKVILQPQASPLPAFTCSSPDKTTVSTIAVKIVKSFGASVQSTMHNQTEQNLLKYTMPPLSTPIMTNKIKLLDKKVKSNTSLPPHTVKVATIKDCVVKHADIPDSSFSKRFKLTSADIDQTCRKLLGQGEISKEIIKGKVKHKPVTERENSVKIIVGNKLRDTEVTAHQHSGENIVQGFEPSLENLSNKTKALRALHKSYKPFKWENNASPSKTLRSKTRENKSNFEDEKNMESTKPDKVCKRKLNIKNQKAIEKSSDYSKLEDNHRNLRDKKKIETEHLSKKACTQDMLVKKQISTEGREIRKREQSSSEKDIRTRSRSGSKDKTKVSEEKNTVKQKDEITVKNKRQDKEIIVLNKQTKGKVETKQGSGKQSDTSSTDENVKSAMTLRHCSVEKEEVSAKIQKRNAESGESEGTKTKLQKISLEFEDGKEHHSSKTSDEEFAAKICKLDGTSNSPEKGEVLKCAHTIYIPGCDNCDQRRIENKKLGKEPSRPAVRQIIHKGRLFEIQRGCVTETDIQDFTTNSGSVVKETGTDDQVQTRSRRVLEKRKRAHSPDSSFETSLETKSGTVGMVDINRYISQTLRDIKRQRESNSNNKWTVKQKKRTRDPFPYSFKKANSNFELYTPQK